MPKLSVQSNKTDSKSFSLTNWPLKMLRDDLFWAIGFAEMWKDYWWPVNTNSKTHIMGIGANLVKHRAQTCEMSKEKSFRMVSNYTFLVCIFIQLLYFLATGEVFMAKKLSSANPFFIVDFFVDFFCPCIRPKVHRTSNKILWIFSVKINEKSYRRSWSWFFSYFLPATAQTCRFHHFVGWVAGNMWDVNVSGAKESHAMQNLVDGTNPFGVAI